MEEGHIGRQRTTLAEARARRRKQLCAPRQGRNVTPDDEALLEKVQQRIAQLVVSPRVLDLGRAEPAVDRDSATCCRGASGVLYVGDRDAIQELDRCFAQRRFLMQRLGPCRVPFGMVLDYHLNGYVYRFAPCFAWGTEFMRDTDPWSAVSVGLHARRDMLIWLLWHYRRKAKIEIARLSFKVRGGLSKCVACGDVHRRMRRTNWETGVLRGCRRCGADAHQEVRPRELPQRPWKITKAALRRRFKVSERELATILSAQPRRADEEQSA